MNFFIYFHLLLGFLVSFLINLSGLILKFDGDDGDDGDDGNDGDDGQVGDNENRQNQENNENSQDDLTFDNNRDFNWDIVLPMYDLDPHNIQNNPENNHENDPENDPENDRENDRDNVDIDSFRNRKRRQLNDIERELAELKLRMASPSDFAENKERKDRINLQLKTLRKKWDKWEQHKARRDMNIPGEVPYRLRQEKMDQLEREVNDILSANDE